MREAQSYWMCYLLKDSASQMVFLCVGVYGLIWNQIFLTSAFPPEFLSELQKF